MSLLFNALKYYFFSLKILAPISEIFKNGINNEGQFCSFVFVNFIGTFCNASVGNLLSPENPGGLSHTLLYVFQHLHLCPWNLLKGQTTFSMSTRMTHLVWNCGRRIQRFIGEPPFSTTKACGFLVIVPLNYTAKKAFSSHSQILLSKHQNMMIRKNLNMQVASALKVCLLRSLKGE